MPQMTLNRRFVLMSKSGRSILFEKDIPTHVPPELYQEAIGIGATNVDGAPADVIKEDDVKRDPQGAARVKVIEDAFEVLIKKNARFDFTAGGMPAPQAVSDIVHFRVDSKEIKTLWQAFQDAKTIARMEADEASRVAAAAEKAKKA